MWGQLFGLKSSDDEESFKIALELAKPARGEDKSLPVHVERCAQRFEALVGLSRAQYEQSRANKFLLYVMIGILVVTKVLTVDTILEALGKIFAAQ